MRSGRSRSSGTGKTLPVSSSSGFIELVLVALAGARLGAEAALQPARADAWRRAAGLRVAGAAAVGRSLAVAAAASEVRRPWCDAQALLLVAPREVVQRVERAGVRLDVRRRVAPLGQERGDGLEAQVAGLGVGHVLPAQGGRDARVRRRAHGPAGSHRPISRVLVVVDEHAVALLLPPPARGEVGDAALHLPRERERSPADLSVIPPRLDADVDVDPLRARGL